MLANGIKVRCSDHGISNIDRMKNEIPLFSFNINDVIEEIERFFFPLRYKKVTTLVFGGKHFMGKDKLDSIKCEFKVIKDVAFITKKGREMSEIIRKNIEEVTYVKLK